MKNISYVINGVLAVAIIVLFILFFTSNNENSEGSSSSLSFSKGDSTGVLPVAYVNMDSLIMNYNYAKDANEVLMKKYNSMNATLTQKQRLFENEVTDFQRKVQNNAFLSTERAEQESRRIQKLESDLHATAERMREDYVMEQNKTNAQVTDSVRTCLKIYNKVANYQIIFNNLGLDNILLAKDSYDITKDVLTLLNGRYKSDATK